VTQTVVLSMQVMSEWAARRRKDPGELLQLQERRMVAQMVQADCTELACKRAAYTCTARDLFLRQSRVGGSD